MNPRPTWLHTRSAELRAALLDLGITITDTEAHTILDNQLTEYSALMHVTRRTAQQNFTDDRLLAFARTLALHLSDEAPGANLIEFERTISVPVAAIGLTTAALAEALKVTHINLDDKETTAGLSLLSNLGMICADAATFLVPVPPATTAAYRPIPRHRSNIHRRRRTPSRRSCRRRSTPFHRHPRRRRRRDPRSRQRRRRRHSGTVAHPNPHPPMI